MSAFTRSKECAKRSKLPALHCAICRRTLRTSIQSSCPTAPSRHSCESVPSALNRHFAAVSDSSCDGCPPKPAPTSSLTQDMLQHDRNPLYSLRSQPLFKCTIVVLERHGGLPSFVFYNK